MRGGALTSKDSDEIAIKTGDTTSFVKVDEIWDSENGKFVSTTFSNLLSKISNGTNFTTIESRINSSSSSAITATDIRGYTTGKTSSQSVVVRLGGLDWIVTYLSKDMSGNVIATLWLSNNVQEAFQGRSQTEGEYMAILTADYTQTGRTTGGMIAVIHTQCQVICMEQVISEQ